MNMADGGPPGTDMTSISFRDQMWLKSFPLDRGLVFDYFALSPFYDRSCNNEQLRMRGIHPLDMANLQKMLGLEYILLEAQEPNLFVIRKQKRDGVEKTTPLAAYYILDGSIYQAPQLQNVLGSRVARALYHINKAYRIAASKLEKVGYDVKSTDAKQDLKSGEDEAKVDVKEVFRIDQILTTVLRKLPPAPPPPPIPANAGAPTPAVDGTNPLEQVDPVTGKRSAMPLASAAKRPKGQ